MDLGKAAYELANRVNKDMVVSISGSRIRCAWKYSATQDMWLDFDHLGCSGLNLMRYVYKAPNTGSRVSRDLFRAATLFTDMITDTVGPYVTKATGGSSNGASGFLFSGGVHAFDGTSNDFTKLGSAASVSTKVYADGVLVSDGETVVCDRIDIEVVNDIQGYNTTAIGGRALTPAGGFTTPRAIIRETVHYTVTPGSVEVTNDIQALEALQIERYYGIQLWAAQPLWTKVHYVNGQQSTWVDIGTLTTSDSGVKTSYPNVDRIMYSNTARTDFHGAWMDNNYGLGTRANVAGTEKYAFSTNIPKSYFSLVYSSNLIMTVGQVVQWRGGYVWFESLPCPGVDLAYAFKEGDKRKYVVDFIAASTSSLLATYPSDRNKAITVDSSSAGVTVPTRVGSTGAVLNATGYGQAKFTI